MLKACRNGQIIRYVVQVDGYELDFSKKKDAESYFREKKLFANNKRSVKLLELKKEKVARYEH